MPKHLLMLLVILTFVPKLSVVVLFAVGDAFTCTSAVGNVSTPPNDVGQMLLISETLVSMLLMIPIQAVMMPLLLRPLLVAVLLQQMTSPDPACLGCIRTYKRCE